MNLPKIQAKNRNLTETYALMMTKEMKDRLVRLKHFDDIDVPEWIRQLIDQELGKANDKLAHIQRNPA